MAHMICLIIGVSLKVVCMGMAKPHKVQDEKHITKSVELVPKAWARFERFVKDIAKAGPQHRVAKSEPHKPREESKIGMKKEKAPKRLRRPVNSEADT